MEGSQTLQIEIWRSHFQQGQNCPWERGWCIPTKMRYEEENVQQTKTIANSCCTKQCASAEHLDSVLTGEKEIPDLIVR